ncbi:hypothetical protein [Flammeovirga sp. SJP92]|uniref:hypothetical protein n=1 Tax=Flammeovirga sp. SJP92 TaxID=1775430 RepID=UPI00078866A5|nr:hypothetical protein [Flammeovirga sp. SJP92]KXX69912.1 hypothetical protein AVL50_13605 [Flammeovirga sp. SJP92]
MKLISFTKIRKGKPKKKAKTNEDKLTKLWFEVQKKKKRNSLLVKEVNLMKTAYQQHLEEVSAVRFEVLYNYIERLLFLGKEAKLTNKNHQLFQLLVQHYLVEGLQSPFRKTLKFDQLIPDFQMVAENTSTKKTKSQKRKERIEQIKKQLTLLAGAEQIEHLLSEEDWESMIDDEHQIQILFDKKIQPYLFSKQKQKLQKEAIQKAEIREKTTINYTSVHSLYKKLAKKFHPDLVKEEQEKEERHHLMSIITEAKNKEDITTLLDLYSTHFSEEKIEFKEDESEKLLQLLEKQLKDLEAEKSEIIGGPKEHYIYNLFVGKSGSGIEREAVHLRESEKLKQQQLQTQLNELETIEDLQSLLLGYMQ